MATALSRCKVCMRMHSPHCGAVTVTELLPEQPVARPHGVTEIVPSKTNAGRQARYMARNAESVRAADRLRKRAKKAAT